jgi:hypothetical protein
MFLTTAHVYKIKLFDEAGYLKETLLQSWGAFKYSDLINATL